MAVGAADFRRGRNLRAGIDPRRAAGQRQRGVRFEILAAGAEIPPLPVIDHDSSEGSALADHVAKNGNDAEFFTGRNSPDESGVHHIDARK